MLDKLKDLKSRFSPAQSSMILRLGAMVVLAAFFICMNSNFVSPYNLNNLLTDIVPILVMGVGVTFVLLIGSIDLSIGAICSTATVVMALLLPEWGLLAYPVAILVGALAGFLNGIFVVVLKIPSFIATLGSMSIWQTVAYILSKSTPIQIHKSDWGVIGWVSVNFGILPLGFVMALILAAVFWVVQSRTAFGKGCFAVGVNEVASQIAGVNVDRVKLLVFTICGIFSALGGVVLAAKLKSGLPTIGVPMVLSVTAAVVLGGTSLSGGKGGLLPTLLGATLYTMLQNGLNMIGITSYYQEIVFGCLLILAVYYTVDRTDRTAVIK